MSDQYARGRAHARKEIRLSVQDSIHQCGIICEYAQFLGVDGLDTSKVIQAIALLNSFLRENENELGEK